ncbi:MAG: SAM-dependent methyltransferase, partial [Eubacteriales bacterium]
AIDVGYGQLAWKMRSDSRVVCMERTNARYLNEQSLPEKVDWVVSDVSFISVTKIFFAINTILKERGQVILLIKPQFEAGKENVGKKGVVRDPSVHKKVIEDVLNKAEEQKLFVKDLNFSPVRGPEGNIEFLTWLTKEKPFVEFNWKTEVDNVVHNAQIGTE